MTTAIVIARWRLLTPAPRPRLGVTDRRTRAVVVVVSAALGASGSRSFRLLSAGGNPLVDVLSRCKLAHPVPLDESACLDGIGHVDPSAGLWWELLRLLLRATLLLSCVLLLLGRDSAQRRPTRRRANARGGPFLHNLVGLDSRVVFGVLDDVKATAGPHNDALKHDIAFIASILQLLDLELGVEAPTLALVGQPCRWWSSDLRQRGTGARSSVTISRVTLRNLLCGRGRGGRSGGWKSAEDG